MQRPYNYERANLMMHFSQVLLASTLTALNIPLSPKKSAVVNYCVHEFFAPGYVHYDRSSYPRQGLIACIFIDRIIVMYSDTRSYILIWLHVLAVGCYAVLQGEY